MQATRLWKNSRDLDQSNSELEIEIEDPEAHHSSSGWHGDSNSSLRKIQKKPFNANLAEFIGEDVLTCLAEPKS
jgi:hypothetical protein